VNYRDKRIHEPPCILTRLTPCITAMILRRNAEMQQMDMEEGKVAVVAKSEDEDEGPVFLSVVRVEGSPTCVCG